MRPEGKLVSDLGRVLLSMTLLPIHPEGKPGSHRRRVLVLNDPLARQELQEDPEGKVESIVPKIDHEFYDPIEVELVSRVIRQKLKVGRRRLTPG